MLLAAEWMLTCPLVQRWSSHETSVACSRTILLYVLQTWFKHFPRLQLLWTKYPQQRSSWENTEAPFIYCHNEVHALQACPPLGSSLAQCGLVMDKKWGNSWKANVLGYPRCQLHTQSGPYIFKQLLQGLFIYPCNSNLSISNYQCHSSQCPHINY